MIYFVINLLHGQKTETLARENSKYQTWAYLFQLYEDTAGIKFL